MFHIEICEICAIHTSSFYKEPGGKLCCSSCFQKTHAVDIANPDYYKTGGLQPYEYLKMKLTPDQYEGWLIGDALVYLSRYNHKHGDQKVDDLKKAQWFLTKLIEFKQEKSNV